MEYSKKRQFKLRTEEKATRCGAEPLPSGSTELHGSRNKVFFFSGQVQGAEFHNKTPWDKERKSSLYIC